MHKYKAKPLYYDPFTAEIKHNPSSIEKKDLLFFASQHEYRVYQLLCNAFGKQNIVCQYQVEIIPRCSVYPRGKYWFVDFAVISPVTKEPLLLCEAKGEVLREFSYQLACLELNNLDLFALLYVIFPSVTPAFKRIKKKTSNTLFGSRLLTTKEAEMNFKLYGETTSNIS